MEKEEMINIQDALCNILYTKIMEIKGGSENE